jgi:hypothetical protein
LRVDAASLGVASRNGEDRMTGTQVLRIGAAGLLAGAALAGAAVAQTSHGVSRAETVSESVTVQSVDTATRHLVVKRPSGELVSLKVPAEARNLGRLKPGDSITTSYYREVEIALLPPGKAPPQDAATVVTGRAQEGQMPAGLVASRIVVTGAVVGLDHKTHVLKIVSPSGGEVHEFTVVDPQGLKMMSKLKVGDKITAYVDEALLISAKSG